ncbi:MAG: hypothetical protein ACFFD4_00495 [Candidatus Odinarchaeota archaeon]
MKKITAILLIGTMILVAVPTLASPVTIEGIKAGDTVTYTVNEFQVPFDILADEIDDLVFDLEGLQFDLSGSTIAIKVMQTYPSTNYYLLSSYFILGKAIEIPLSDDPANDDLKAILGDSASLPAGTGFGISTNLPGSDWLDDRGGIPFYLDPGSFDAVKSSFENEYMTAAVGTDFVVTADGEKDGATITGTITWFGSGEAAGFLKNASVSVINGTDTSKIGIEYESIKNIPLPEEVSDGNTITFTVDRAEVNYDVTGDLASWEYKTLIDVVAKNYLTDFVGKNVLQFDFTDREGCFYQADIHSLNLSSGNLALLSDAKWFDGFAGMLTNYPSSPYNGESSKRPSKLLAIFPLAPAITPDYKMWGVSVKTIDTMLQIASNSIPDNELDILTETGITTSNLLFNVENRINEDLIYFYSTIRAGIDYINPNKTDETIGGTIKIDGWVAYTKTGLLAGASVLLSADILVTNFPFADIFTAFLPSTPGGIPEIPSDTLNGMLSLDIEVKIRNTDIDSLPDVSEAKPVDLISGDIDGFTSPGFPVVETLVVLVVVGLVSGLFFRKKRY